MNPVKGQLQQVMHNDPTEHDDDDDDECTTTSSLEATHPNDNDATTRHRRTKRFLWTMSGKAPKALASTTGHSTHNVDKDVFVSKESYNVLLARSTKVRRRALSHQDHWASSSSSSSPLEHRYAHAPNLLSSGRFEDEVASTVKPWNDIVVFLEHVWHSGWWGIPILLLCLAMPVWIPMMLLWVMARPWLRPCWTPLVWLVHQFSLSERLQQWWTQFKKTEQHDATSTASSPTHPRQYVLTRPRRRQRRRVTAPRR